MSDEQAVKKVLVIEDDNELRDILTISFDMAGYASFSASNGIEGKEQVELLNPDLIVLDVIMPTLGGMPFLHWLRQDAKLDVPVLVLTSLTGSEIESQALDFGANGIFYKPCSPEDIIEYAQQMFG